MGTGRRNAIAGFGLRLIGQLAEKRGARRIRGRQQGGCGMRQYRAALGKERTLRSVRTEGQTGGRRRVTIHIHHGAVMLAAAAAAGRQIRIRIHEQRRADRREAENRHQKHGRDTPHRFMLLRTRQALQPMQSLISFPRMQWIATRLKLSLAPAAKSGSPSRLKSPTAIPPGL